MNPSNPLKTKVKLLEKQLKNKERLVKKYQQALIQSNARIKKIQAGLKDNINLVKEIHKNLLPVTLPHISGFEISYKMLPTQQGVSGDFFDVMKIKNSLSFRLALSSCNTYALSSLLLSSLLKFSSPEKPYKTTKEFLSSIVQKIFSPVSKKEKISMFYGIISRSSLEMDYCLVGDIFAGHQREGKKLRLLRADQPPWQGKGLKMRRLSFKTNDIFVLCSPGVAQRTNSKGQSFGVKNIEKAIKKGVLETRQSIIFSCNEFAEGQTLLKDCTVLALKAKSRALRVLKVKKPI